MPFTNQIPHQSKDRPFHGLNQVTDPAMLIKGRSFILCFTDNYGHERRSIFTVLEEVLSKNKIRAKFLTGEYVGKTRDLNFADCSLTAYPTDSWRTNQWVEQFELQDGLREHWSVYKTLHIDSVKEASELFGSRKLAAMTETFGGPSGVLVMIDEAAIELNGHWYLIWTWLSGPNIQNQHIADAANWGIRPGDRGWNNHQWLKIP